jgi:hypothetical protein
MGLHPLHTPPLPLLLLLQPPLLLPLLGVLIAPRHA